MNRSNPHLSQQPGEALTPQVPVTVPLVDKRCETGNMTSLFFQYPPSANPSFCPRKNDPGQFVMVWIPGMDEKPFVISYAEEDRFGITVLVKGSFTRQLVNAAPGTRIGFRGPYGRGFWGWRQRPADRKVLLGGGCGMAPLALLAEQANNVTVVQGAPSADDVFFEERFPDQVVYTEDGSAGHSGFPTRWLQEALRKDEVDSVYTCGPEAMMSSVVATCRMEDVACQAAMERYMKCAIGVCGQCECDGRLVCQDGPVFSKEELRNMPSFGSIRRDATGQKVDVATDEHCKID